MRSLILAGGLALVLGASALAQPSQPAPYIAAALADPGRPAADVERDAARHAAEILAFTGVEPGDHVADLVIGGGYFTRLFSVAVGPEGRVTAWQPGEFVAFQASYGQQLRDVDAAYDNVSGVESRFAELDLPSGSLDLVFTSQNYHDFHLQPFPAETAANVNAEVFDALKPGGAYVVIDHYAPDGSGWPAAHTLHRADRAALIAEIEAAGFVLEAESDVLRNADDPRTANVFDDSIRGRTDQFVLRFVKPAAS